MKQCEDLTLGEGSTVTEVDCSAVLDSDSTVFFEGDWFVELQWLWVFEIKGILTITVSPSSLEQMVTALSSCHAKERPH